MKKLIITVLLLSLMSVTAYASSEIMIGTPDVDGILDELYLDSYTVTVTGEKDTFHTSKNANSVGAKGDSATAYYLYDDSCLYVCINVKDDKVFSRGREWIITNIDDLSWENDAVEARIYYPELGSKVQANQYIFQCDAMGIASTNYLGMCEDDYSVATTLISDGYTVEFALPLSFGKKAGDEIGLAIEVDDLHENIEDASSSVGGHDFNAYGSQHPYKNMVKLGTEKAKETPVTFDDAKSHWAKDNISYVAKAGLFEGTEKGFEPNTAMTRAMFATVLGRLHEKKNGTIAESQSKTFTDVDYSAWYGKYVAWASELGIVNGVGESKFAPDDPISRQEMAAMIYRYAKASSSNSDIKFTDSAKISEWAKEAVSYCAQRGYIGGDNTGRFLPRKNATRAEVSAVMERFMKDLTVKIY